MRHWQLRFDSAFARPATLTVDTNQTFASGVTIRLTLFNQFTLFLWQVNCDKASWRPDPAVIKTRILTFLMLCRNILPVLMTPQLAPSCHDGSTRPRCISLLCKKGKRLGDRSVSTMAISRRHFDNGQQGFVIHTARLVDCALITVII